MMKRLLLASAASVSLAFSPKQTITMAYPGPASGDRFGAKVKLNGGSMGIMSEETNAFDSFGSFDDNPSIHLYEHPEGSREWTSPVAPFYTYPIYDPSLNNLNTYWEIKDFAVVGGRNLFVVSCLSQTGVDHCVLRHFMWDGTLWKLILSSGDQQANKDNYLITMTNTLPSIDMQGHGDKLYIACGSTTEPGDLYCDEIQVWKKSDNSEQFTSHQNITGPGGSEDIYRIADISPDGKWLILKSTSTVNFVYENVADQWVYHSTLNDLAGISVDNDRIVATDRTTDTFETYLLVNNTWTVQPAMSIPVGFDVATDFSVDFNVVDDKLFFLNQTGVDVYEFGNGWSLGVTVDDFGANYSIGSFQNLYRISADEFALSAPAVDTSTGMVMTVGSFTDSPTPFPSAAPSGAPTGATASPTDASASPTDSPSSSPTTKSPTSAPNISPTACPEDDGVSTTVLAGAAAGAVLGGTLLGAAGTYFLVVRTASSAAPAYIGARARF